MEIVPDLSNMTNEELDFYYFHLHDTDHNSMLDGLEILQAVMHTAHNFENDAVDVKKNDEDLNYYVGVYWPLDKECEDLTLECHC